MLGIFLLEDCVRDVDRDGKFGRGEVKIKGETDIPFGKYEVEYSYSPRFGRELPLLVDVPHFDGIRVHRGNTAKDTSGCILVGENKVKGSLIKSTIYEGMLCERIRICKIRGEDCFIEIE